MLVPSRPARIGTKGDSYLARVTEADRATNRGKIRMIILRAMHSHHGNLPDHRDSFKEVTVSDIPGT